MYFSKKKVLSFKTRQEQVRFLCDEFSNKELANVIVDLLTDNTNQADKGYITLQEEDYKKLFTILQSSIKVKQKRQRTSK